MKAVAYSAILLALTLFACSKNNASSGGWQLVKKNWSLGPNGGIMVPGVDSAVSLDLKGNNTYVSRLNNNIVSQGSYKISPDGSNYNRLVLELNDFKPTGIFSMFRLFQLGTNGQVVSEFDGLYMHISHDTMTLSSPLTPGGNVSYTFVKR